MENWAPIQYRDFWDVPRIFLVAARDHRILFDCPFDEEREDYPNHYRVYLLPPLSEDQLAGTWVRLPDLATQFLGQVPINEVRFDPTRRQAIDAGILQRFAALSRTG